MRTKFDLGCYELLVDEDVPRAMGDQASVHLEVIHHHLPTVAATAEEVADCERRGWKRELGADNVFQVPDEVICAMSVKPSHARAIASAILSAATEARG